MKITKFFLPLILIFLTSCSAVRVQTDYNNKIDFKPYKTFAFYKTGIDKAPISDLDKKRIMRAIEGELLLKGMTKSKTPDVLVSLFTKSRERVNINNNNAGLGFGYGAWNPWMWRGGNQLNVNQYTEGTLFVDIIDASKKELIWQGIGSGILKAKNVEQKEERIKEFVKEILSKYPPGMETK